LLAACAQLFHAGLLTAVTLTATFCVIFFFASAGASAAYLTISEIFPLKMRAQAISFFFAISQGIGGVIMPTLFSGLIGTGTDRVPLALGCLGIAVIMALGAAVAWFLGVDAERKSLEQVADPISTRRHGIEPTLRPGPP
jgi:MFS family permease